MHDRPMRTTIEIRDEYRARLLEIAARRGEKGFSRIVEQALEAYLRSEEAREEARRLALASRGSLTAKEAAGLEARAREVRESWR